MNRKKKTKSCNFSRCSFYLESDLHSMVAIVCFLINSTYRLTYIHRSVLSNACLLLVAASSLRNVESRQTNDDDECHRTALNSRIFQNAKKRKKGKNSFDFSACRRCRLCLVREYLSIDESTVTSPMKLHSLCCIHFCTRRRRNFVIIELNARIWYFFHFLDLTCERWLMILLVVRNMNTKR